MDNNFDFGDVLLSFGKMANGAYTYVENPQYHSITAKIVDEPLLDHYCSGVNGDCYSIGEFYDLTPIFLIATYIFYKAAMKGYFEALANGIKSLDNIFKKE